MELSTFLAWATLLLAVPISAIVAYLLYHQWRQAPKLRFLRERFVSAVALTVLWLFFGLIFVNNDQTIPPINLDATKILTRAVLLIVSLVSSSVWLWAYWSRKRGDSRNPEYRAEQQSPDEDMPGDE